MAEITASTIERAQRKASTEARKIDKALGLPYHIVRGGYLYRVDPDGATRKVKKVEFGLRKVDLREIEFKDGKYKVQIVRRP